MLKKRFLCHKCNILFLAFICCLIFNSCGMSELATDRKIDYTELTAECEKDEVYTYIENTYGFANELVYGEYTSAITRNENESKADSHTKFKADSKGGAVFYKPINTEDESAGYVCIYLSDEENNGIYLNCEYGKGYKLSDIKRQKISLATPHMKSRCYCEVKDNYLIVTELAEKNEGWYDGYYYLAYEEENKEISTSSSNLCYEEKVIIYDLNDAMKEKIEIVRKIAPKESEEIKEFKISEDAKSLVYASGYSSYKNDSAQLISTEQEFCNEANRLIAGYAVDWIEFTRTSWENRWYRLQIDESSIPKDMVKVDFECSSGKADNDTVTSDIVIKVNSEKEEHGVLVDEGADNPIDYGSSEDETGDASRREELNLNGTWVSMDEKYVFSFKSQVGSIGIDYDSGISVANGTFSCVDITTGNKRIQGSFNFSDENTLIVTENLSMGKTIKFSFGDGKLISDKITLTKIPDEMVTQFEGTWQNSDEKMVFQNDGVFKDEGKYNSTWGYYYVLSATKVLLSDKSDNFKTINYTITGNSMNLGEYTKLSRISDGADANILSRFKDIIVGTWKPTSSDYEEYRFASDGTWERYQVFYSGNQNELVSETFLEGGTYKVLSDKMVEIDKQGGIQFNRLNYNEVTGIIYGDGISLEKK